MLIAGLLLPVAGSYSGTFFGIDLRFGATAGFQVTPELRLSVGAEIPLLINYTNTAFLQIGPMLGGGVVYFLEKSWSAGFNLRFGPQVYSLQGSTAQLGFIAQVVVGYRR